MSESFPWSVLMVILLVAGSCSIGYTSGKEDMCTSLGMTHIRIDGTVKCYTAEQVKEIRK